MSTCPRCMGPLTDSHRCPRRPLRAAAEILACALAGGTVGLLLVVLIDPRGSASSDALAITAGAVIAVVIYRAIRR